MLRKKKNKRTKEDCSRKREKKSHVGGGSPGPEREKTDG